MEVIVFGTRHNRQVASVIVLRVIVAMVDHLTRDERRVICEFSDVPVFEPIRSPAVVNPPVVLRPAVGVREDILDRSKEPSH
jgi:hypothetical protein